MAELQSMKDAAQVEMDKQKTNYETRISQLSKDMVSHFQEFQKATAVKYASPGYPKY
jgi:hypothetical protein